MTPEHIGNIDPLAALRRPGPYFCRDCGKPIAGGPGACPPCGEAHTRSVRRDEIVIARGTIPNRFRWATLSTPDLVQRVRMKFDPAVSRTLALDLPPAVVLQGPSRSGKTSFACAMLRAIHDAGIDGDERAFQRAKLSVFIAARDLDSDKVVDNALDAAVLVLDDLGQDLGGAQVDSGVLAMRIVGAQRVICERHDEELPTILTTPFSAEKVLSLYGDGVLGRLQEKPNRWLKFGSA